MTITKSQRPATTQCFLIITTLLTLICFSGIASAGWNFGIGTGPGMQEFDGDIGMETIVGPVDFDVDLDSEDTDDLLESAFGLGGYATDGKWMFSFKVGYLELEDSGSYASTGGNNTSAKLTFEKTGAQFTLGYPIYAIPRFTLRAYGGVRYTNHEWDMKITGDGFASIDDSAVVGYSMSIEEDWTDALVGLAATVHINDKWSWKIAGDFGFGESEGSTSAYTGLTWMFWGPLSVTLSYNYDAIEFENGSRGSSDWYLYDVDETNLGLVFLFNW